MGQLAEQLWRGGRRLWQRLPGWGIAAVLGVVASLVFHSLVTTRFDQNDDVAFLIALSGWNGGLSSPGIVWSNILLSQPLLWLYAIWPGVEWYVLYLAAGHGVTAGLLVWLFPPKPDRLLHHGIFLLLLAGLLLPLWLRLQFTSLAVMMSATGLLVMVRGSDRDDGEPPDMGPALVGGLMLGAGSLIRASAAWLAIAWLLPLLVWSLRRISRRQWLRFGVCAALIIGIGQVSHKSWYGADPWPDYFDYVHSSSQLLDTEDKHRITYKAVREAGGWSDNDVRIFRDWIFPDREVHSLDSMRRLIAAAKLSQHGRSRKELIERVDKERRHYQPVFRMFLVLAALLLWLGPPRLRWWTLAFLGWTAALLLYLAVFRKVVDRIVLPMALTGSLAMLHQLDRAVADGRIVPRRLLPLALVGAMLLGAGPHNDVGDLVQLSARNKAGVKRLVDQLHKVEQVDPKAVLLTQPTSLPFRLWPVSLTPMPATGVTFLGSGWASHHPLNLERLRRMKIDAVVPTLLEREHHYLLAKQRFMKLFNTYVAEHHGMRVIVRDKWLINPEQDAWLYRLDGAPLANAERAP